MFPGCRARGCCCFYLYSCPLLCGLSHPPSTLAQIYQTENSRSRQLVSFQVHTIFSSVMRLRGRLHPTQNVTRPHAQRGHAARHRAVVLVSGASRTALTELLLQYRPNCPISLSGVGHLTAPNLQTSAIAILCTGDNSLQRAGLYPQPRAPTGHLGTDPVAKGASALRYF